MAGLLSQKEALSRPLLFIYICVYSQAKLLQELYASVFGVNPKQIMLGYSHARLAIVKIWCFCPSPTNPYGPKEAGNTRQHEQ